MKETIFYTREANAILGVQFSVLLIVYNLIMTILKIMLFFSFPKFPCA